MPWRLIVFLVGLTIVVLFAGFNIGNVSDISFGFYTLTKVPVFVSLFIAFLLGTFLVLPFAFTRRNAKGRAEKGRKSIRNADTQAAAETPVQLEEQPVDTSMEPSAGPAEPVEPKKKRGRKR